MAIAFNPKITSAGLAAAIAANGAGLQLQITHVALGTGAYDPTGSETALVGRKEKATIASASGGGTAQFTVVATFPSGYAGADYNVGEVGFYAGDPDAGGVLFAVASRASLIYTTRGSATGIYSAEYAVALSGAPAGSVNVTVDPAAVIASGLLTGYVRKIGDTMTGPLVLSGNATLPLQAVTLQQLQAVATTTAGDFATSTKTVLSVGAASDPVGTVGSSGWEKSASGVHKQWAAMQCYDDGGATVCTFTFPNPTLFTTGVIRVSDVNLAPMAGQSGAASGGVIAVLNPTATQLTFYGHSTNIVGTKFWALIEVEGF